MDPNADHKGCMTAFADAGIYLFVDLDTFTTQIEQVRATKLGVLREIELALIMENCI